MSRPMDRPATAGGLRVRTWIEQPRVQNFIIGLIVVNAALLGLETSASAMAAAGGLIIALDRAILAVFVGEIALRLYVHRAAFWRDPWSVFDFAVVAIALLPATGPLAVLRALRVLRVLRLLTMVPSMRRVVGALLAAIPGLGSIAMVLLIVYYVFAVIATKLFAATHPEWFGSLGRSLYTLFQIMTLESWSMGIARPVMENFPYAWIFFICFILVATFTMLNLFIAIIVNAMQSYTEAEQHDTKRAVEAAREHIEADLHTEMRSLRDEIRALKSMLSGSATIPPALAPGRTAGTEG
ncbi:ion transporter [Accumulibacter sp.]|uniref:ion transporter n=1 Tax=Accumulibacter sp. TaxID=2053492 RepID=UPI0025FCC9FB|nr:ion transporter [Accumulibacter sp.]MCM8611265.1 ion transporter [Accumulibacter sp.]MCM8635322.1 ion transporter [Accumulibacter sp.]MCM8638747.1 ion transporter [Accumulibacter sp.]